MINGKAYIGQAKNIERRWKTHITKHNNPKNKEYNKVLYCAMRKYGFENFEFEILIECEEELLDLMEIYYIEKYNTYIHSENSNGYNMNKGGGGSKGAKRTRKQKKNLSIKAKERFNRCSLWMYDSTRRFCTKAFFYFPLRRYCYRHFQYG